MVSAVYLYGGEIWGLSRLGSLPKVIARGNVRIKSQVSFALGWGIWMLTFALISHDKVIYKPVNDKVLLLSFEKSFEKIE